MKLFKKVTAVVLAVAMIATTITISNTEAEAKVTLKSKKNITLKLDKSTIRFLAAKKVKSVQWDRGKTRVTMSLKKIKKVNKRMKKNVYLQVKKGVLVTYYTRK